MARVVQRLNVTHDAHWIKEGCPNAGRLAGFNNKGVSNNQSAADQIVTPIVGYNYTFTAGQAYSPSSYTDRHACNGYSSNMGSTFQLPNGNQIICIATSGKVYEINSAGTQLWSKTFTGSCPQAQKYSKCYIDNAAPAIPTWLSGLGLSDICYYLSMVLKREHHFRSKPHRLILNYPGVITSRTI
ncbi:MAG: hypothetical protein IPN26_18035 [Bacteroidetes bacterium]|nr:hypothetical protein [Bacteroidota bacterium]